MNAFFAVTAIAAVPAAVYTIASGETDLMQLGVQAPAALVALYLGKHMLAAQERSDIRAHTTIRKIADRSSQVIKENTKVLARVATHLEEDE